MIWSDFQNPVPGVKRKARDGFNKPDGIEMKYWNPRPSTCQDYTIMIKDTVSGAGNGNGSCIAWSQLFHRTLKAQGIGGSRIFMIIADVSVNPGADSFLVKNWNFLGAGAPGLVYPYVIGVDALDLRGVPGQGNDDPPEIFRNHWVVRYNNKIWDPSYGGGPFTSKLKHQTESLAGIASGGNAKKISSTKLEMEYVSDRSRE
jgi:hypothetical protein